MIGELAASAGRSAASGERGVQPAELVVAGKRQIQMHALQIRPAMPAAVEDAIKRFVDGPVLMRPEAHFAAGSIHGCIAAASAARRAAQAAALITHLVLKARPAPATTARIGSLVFSSTTCRTSSFDQGCRRARHPRHSRRRPPATDSSAIGRTSSVSASTTMYSISTPKASNRCKRA